MDQKPRSQAVNNWRLLEDDIVTALQAEGLTITNDAFGDPCVGEVNIAKLAQTLSPGVLLKITPLSVKID